MKTKTVFILEYVIILFTLFRNVLSENKCPPSSIISKPCNFHEWGEDGCAIECDTDGDLMAIFANLSQTLKATEKHFAAFNLYGYTMIELPANVFADIQFDILTIHPANGIRVHRMAFNGTAGTVHELTLGWIGDGDAEPDNEYDLFAAIHSLQALKTIWFSNTKLTLIPDGAIHSHPLLTAIYFDGNRRLERIGPNAFRDLPALNTLGLTDNVIRDVDGDAFPLIGGRIDELLRIDFRQNKLHDDTIQPGTFRDIRRPVELNLNFNRYEFINETIFAPFLKQNQLNIIYSLSNCIDTRNDWLRHEYFDQWYDCDCHPGNCATD